MYIKHEAVADSDAPGATTALLHEEHTDGDRVAFDPETGRARVTAEVGEQLAEHYDAIVVDEREDGDRDQEDTDT